jgi:hypothetical protein
MLKQKRLLRYDNSMCTIVTMECSDFLKVLLPPLADPELERNDAYSIIIIFLLVNVLCSSVFCTMRGTREIYRCFTKARCEKQTHPPIGVFTTQNMHIRSNHMVLHYILELLGHYSIERLHENHQ